MVFCTAWLQLYDVFCRLKVSSAHCTNTTCCMQEQHDMAGIADPPSRTPPSHTHPPPTGKVFPLAQWAEAVAHSQQEARGGKVLLACS
jgi:hypothetical protein